MKYLIRRIVAFILGLLASFVIRKYRPKVIMVTGSVGKTSTKDAIAAVLRSHFYLRASEKSYNTEFGVPFTIFGVKNPWHNPAAWLTVFKEAFALIFLPNHYPKVLVLEVGADRPGDLHKILEIVLPDIVVVTHLPEVPVHVEAYASPEAVREEEFMPAYLLPAGAPLIVNAACEHALTMAQRVPAKLITFGYTHADTALTEPKVYLEHEKVVGMQATFTVAGQSAPAVVRGSVGYQQLLPAAAAVATALALSMTFEQAIEGLERYVPPPGRGRIFNGVNGSLLVDDTYNSSPAAVVEALETLKMLKPAKRRIAILGDMLELGRYSVGEHERIGRLGAKNADILISVGVRARAFNADHAFDDARSAALALKEFVKPGDVILVKGSQSMRMERIVEALLADPADMHQLVRQEKEWRRSS